MSQRRGPVTSATLLAGALLAAGCGALPTSFVGDANTADSVAPRTDAAVVSDLGPAPDAASPCALPGSCDDVVSMPAPDVVSSPDSALLDVPVWGPDASGDASPSVDAARDSLPPDALADAPALDAPVPDAPTPDAPAPDAPAPDAPTGDAAEAGATLYDAAPEASSDYCALLPSHDPYTLYLSADDSNSMASPVIVRRLLNGGHLPPKSLVRTYEFLNYYNVPYEPAAAGTVRVVPQLRAGSSPGSYSLQLGVQSEARAPAQVSPLALTLVLDTSESMSPVNRIGRMRAAVTALAHNLRAGDHVNAVTWNVTHTIELEDFAVTGPDDATVQRMVNLVSVSSATDLSSGLQAGYDLALRHFHPGALNRVVLISDGEANLGVTDATVIARAARAAEGAELYLAGISVGDGYNDTLFNAVTDAGRGAYVYLDDENEAQRMLGQRFVEVLDLAQRSVRLELTLPWYMRVLQTSAEAISGDPLLVDPQHLAPNDAMVFFQTLRACSATVASDGDPLVATATFEHPFTRAPDQVTVRTTVGELLRSSATQLHRGAAIVAWAEALRSLEGYELSGDHAASHAALAAVRAALAVARAEADDAALQELTTLVARADALVP